MAHVFRRTTRREKYAKSFARGGTTPLLPIAAWAAIGVSLVAGVGAWKLTVSNYAADVQTICKAEHESGFAIEKETSRVTEWVRAHLTTPEGNELFSDVANAQVIDRAGKLRRETSAQRIRDCPIIDAYERLAAMNAYRADLQKICSTLTFPDLEEQDDDARLARLRDLVDAQAKSPRTRELIEPLRRAAAGARGRLLRSAAAEVDIYRCDVAKAFESPPPEAAGPPSTPTSTTVSR
jgi:hypothetical protein